MKRTLSASLVRDGDWYVAQCLDVDVASQGETAEDALTNLQEALELHVEPPIATIVPPPPRSIAIPHDPRTSGLGRGDARVAQFRTTAACPPPRRQMEADSGHGRTPVSDRMWCAGHAVCERRRPGGLVAVEALSPSPGARRVRTATGRPPESPSAGQSGRSRT